MTYKEFAQQYDIEMLIIDDNVYFNINDCNESLKLYLYLSDMISEIKKESLYVDKMGRFYILPQIILNILYQRLAMGQMGKETEPIYKNLKQAIEYESILIQEIKTKNKELSAVIKLQRINGEFVITIPEHAKERVKKLLTEWLDAN